MSLQHVTPSKRLHLKMFLQIRIAKSPERNKTIKFSTDMKQSSPRSQLKQFSQQHNYLAMQNPALAFPLHTTSTIPPIIASVAPYLIFPHL